MKKFIAVLLLITLSMSMVACGGSKKDNNTDLVKVGNTTITEDKLSQYLEFTAFIQNIDLTQFPEESMKNIKAQMLEDLISLECIKQHFKGKEKDVLPSTIKEDLQSFLKQAKSTKTISTFLKEKKISEKVLTEFYYDQYYRQAYVNEVKAGMKDLDQQAKDYYDKNKESFKIDEVTASHILVKDEAQAKDILAKLKAGGNFAELAKQYSIDPGSKDKGGSLGTFGRGEMVTEFENAAFALKPGELSDVVKSKFGYHIIKVTDKKQGTKTFDESKESIISTLVNQEAEKQSKELRKSAKVEYLTKEYTGKTKAE
jgi:foldase protein PrsA